MPVASAALLVHRRGPTGPEVLLAHPGGPYWRGRDVGAWSIPKGLIEEGETDEAAAVREFREETGLAPPRPLRALAPVRVGGRKVVRCWLAEGDLDLDGFRSNAFELEWPPRSGRRIAAPEIDALRYVAEPEAMTLVHPGQRPILEEAFRLLSRTPDVAPVS